MKMNPLSSFIKKMLYETEISSCTRYSTKYRREVFDNFVLSEFEDIGDFMAY